MILKRRTIRSFTLLEMILYLGFFALIAGAMVNLAMTIVIAAKKADIVHEMQTNMSYITDQITRSIHSSGGINQSLSIFGSDTGKLVLIQPPPNLHLTVISCRTMASSCKEERKTR